MNAHPRWQIRRTKDGHWTYTRMSWVAGKPWFGGKVDTFTEAIERVNRIIGLEKTLAMTA